MEETTTDPIITDQLLQELNTNITDLNKILSPEDPEQNYFQNTSESLKSLQDPENDYSLNKLIDNLTELNKTLKDQAITETGSYTNMEQQLKEITTLNQLNSVFFGLIIALLIVLIFGNSFKK